MKTNSLLTMVLIFAFLSLNSETKAQGGTLQFSQGLIVNSTAQTVPAGKIWKITSIYGMDRICIPVVAPDYVSSSSYLGYYLAFVGTSFSVNGRSVFSERKWDVTPTNASYLNIYSDNICKSKYTDSARSWGAYEIAPNYNILPMWLPAGTVLQTSSANVMLSVLEFNIL